MSVQRWTKDGVAPKKIICDWRGGLPTAESTLHQLSPYIGKIKSAMAASLIQQLTCRNDLLLDPFSGCGTIALEAWRAGRRIIANDLSPYAQLLTRAKLFPPRHVNSVQRKLSSYVMEVGLESARIDLRKIPPWVRQFFHSETLRELMAWVTVLRRHGEHFLLSCLMGILHHQRPGFLSFPCSHTVPYLRTSKFPRAEFPELYQYRPVTNRLLAKMQRAFKRFPELDRRIQRRCLATDASLLIPSEPIDAIITSPPYMRQLDYGRDNRLRLWFLSKPDWQSLDARISPRRQEFMALMRKCLIGWHSCLRPKGRCILILGDVRVADVGTHLPELVAELAVQDLGSYTLEARVMDKVPNARRVRRSCRGSLSETILVLRKKDL
jgi:hypothetical protein